jgi:methionine sulfoxide reductase heme-binding subunit
VNSVLSSKWTKAAVFLACLTPLAVLVWRTLHNGLGPNPPEFLEHATGDWILRFLVITLAITPLRRLLRLPQLIRFRRMLGLFAFFYAFCHFGIWAGIDKTLDWHDMLTDIGKRPYITVGFTGFMLLVPLAVTSTAGWIRRLGGRRWQMLHRLIYASAVAGVIHYYWLVKSDVRKPVFYGALVGILLLWRIVAWFIDRTKRGEPAAGAAREKPATAGSA